MLRTDSIAVWTALSLLMQLGDRHCGNFLVDRSTGVLHCIDFEALFDSGVNLAVPETMFCRLTPVIRALIPQGMFETRFKDVVHQVCALVQQDINEYQAAFADVKRTSGQGRANQYVVRMFELLRKKNFNQFVEMSIDQAQDGFKLCAMFDGWDGLDDCAIK